jgi:hypothetical protein
VLPDRRVLAAVVLIVAAESARAQLSGTLGGLPPSHPQKCREVIEERRIDDEEHARAKAWAILGEQGYGTTPGFFRANTMEMMRSAGELPTIQRLEVTGVWTNDDASPAYAGRFDAHLHPSHLAEVEKQENESLKWIPSKTLRDLWYARARAKAKAMDLKEAREEMNGRLTQRGRASLSYFKDLYVNEIVAHSWGTDIVYNGILEGYIHPPKRIILIGVPSPYLTKWAELARRLPVEVRIYSSPEDAVRTLNSVWGMRSAVNLDAPPVYSEDVWKKKVEGYCARSGNRCKDAPGGRVPVEANMRAVNRAFGLLRHDREAYYDFMAADGELSQTPEQMRQQLEDVVTGRMNDLFGNAMARARAILRASPLERTTRRVCADIAEPDPSPAGALAPTSPPASTPVPVPVPAPFPIYPGYDAYKQLYALATMACLNPSGLTQDEMLRRLNGFPDGKTYDVSEASIPSGCLRDLFIELMGFNAVWSRTAALDRVWLIEEAERLNRKHTPMPISPGADGDTRPRRGPVYNGPCGNGGSLCGSNRL